MPRLPAPPAHRIHDQAGRGTETFAQHHFRRSHHARLGAQIQEDRVSRSDRIPRNHVASEFVRLLFSFPPGFFLDEYSVGALPGDEGI